MILWVIVITILHGSLNLGWFDKAKSKDLFSYKIGFLPVTCHLTCPVTDFINREQTGEGLFEPIRFNGFPELKEAFLAGQRRRPLFLPP